MLEELGLPREISVAPGTEATDREVPVDAQVRTALAVARASSATSPRRLVGPPASRRPELRGLTDHTTGRATVRRWGHARSVWCRRSTARRGSGRPTPGTSPRPPRRSASTRCGCPSTSCSSSDYDSRLPVPAGARLGPRPTSCRSASSRPALFDPLLTCQALALATTTLRVGTAVALAAAAPPAAVGPRGEHARPLQRRALRARGSASAGSPRSSPPSACRSPSGAAAPTSTSPRCARCGPTRSPRSTAATSTSPAPSSCPTRCSRRGRRSSSVVTATARCGGSPATATGGTRGTSRRPSSSRAWRASTSSSPPTRSSTAAPGPATTSRSRSGCGSAAPLDELAELDRRVRRARRVTRRRGGADLGVGVRGPPRPRSPPPSAWRR